MQTQDKNQKNDRPCLAVIRQGTVENESKSDKKELSPFCNDCESVKNPSEIKETDVFTDKYGFLWRCRYLACPHAMKDGPVIMDCMVLNRIYLKAPGSIQDLPRIHPDKRRKFRAQLAREFKMITGVQAVV